MDLGSAGKQLTEKLKQYKYVALIIAVGLLFMIFPFSREESVPQPTVTNEKSVEEELAQILSRVKGAGNVEVLLTCSAGEQTLYQTDVDETDTSLRVQTVLVTDSQRTETGLIRQVIPGIYRGAIVVCQGADDPAVKLMIVDAVSKVTGLGADKISVMKMK